MPICDNAIPKMKSFILTKIIFRAKAKMGPAVCFAKKWLKGIDAIVEVGVASGIHAQKMAEALKPKKLYVIDIEYNPIIQKRLENVNYEFIHKPSVEAAKGFEDGSLDLVYIDAGHTQESVIEDIDAWYPKIKKGGIICGHDYYHIKHKLKPAIDRKIPDVSSEYLVGTRKNAEWWKIKDV